MPTTGPVKGGLLNIYIGSVMIGCATGATFSTETSTQDVACKESEGNADHVLDVESWSISGNGVLKFDAAYGAFDLLAAKKAKTPITALFSTQVTGDDTITGTGSITSFELSSEVGSPATYSYTITGKGAYTLGVVPV